MLKDRLQMAPIKLLGKLATLDRADLLDLKSELETGDGDRAKTALAERGLGDLFRDDPSGWLTVLLAFLTLLLMLRPADHSLTPDQVDNLVKTVISQMDEDHAPAPPAPSAPSPASCPVERDA